MAEKYIQITDNAGTPTTPISGKVRVYQEGNDLKVIDPLGVITNLTEVAAGGAGQDYYIANEILVDPTGSTITGKLYTTLEAAVDYANINATSTMPLVVRISSVIDVAVNITVTNPHVSIHGNGYVESIIRFDAALAGTTCLNFALTSSSPNFINGRLKDIRIIGNSTLQTTANTVGVGVDGSGLFYFDSVTVREFNTNIHAGYTGVIFSRLLIQNSYIARSEAIGLRITDDMLVTLVNTNVNSMGNGDGIRIEDTAVLFWAVGEVGNASGGTGTGIRWIGGGAAFGHFISSVRINSLSLGVSVEGSGQAAQVVEFTSCKWEQNTVDAYSEGANTTIDSSGNVLDFTKAQFNPLDLPDIIGNFRDRAVGDSGTKFFEELAVGSVTSPSEAIFGEGDSYVTGMLVYTFDGVTYTNVFEDAKDPIDGNVVQFPALTADNAIYLSSAFGAKFQGFKCQINQIANLGAGDIAFEYWNGSAWVEVNHMITYSGDNYLPLANEKFLTAGSFQVRFDERIIEDWATNDPPTLGASYHWLRLRITATINQTPTFDQFKIHSSRTEINADGFNEYFAFARPIEKFPVSFGSFVAGANSPVDQDIYIGGSLFAGRIENSLVSNTLDRTGVAIALPFEIDTSCPIRVHVIHSGESAVSGDIIWEIRWGWISPGSEIYLTSGAAPATAINERSIQRTTTYPVNEANLVQEEFFDLEIPEAVSQRLIGGVPSQGDVIFITIARLGNEGADTYLGDTNLIDLAFYYTSWRTGGHIKAEF